MKRRLLAVFAHPDDEAFGPGGTLAKYALSGTDIRLLSATKGEEGNWQNEEGKNSPIEIHHTRAEELEKSCKILGIKELFFLGFRDGALGNNIYHKLAEKIMNHINDFNPQVVMTYERLGISGHLDHIAVSMITTYAFLNSNQAQKLYYYCMPKDARDKALDKYFVYFPEGYDQKVITTRIDYAAHWENKVASMNCHQTQISDVRRILKRLKNRPKIDYFILQKHRGIMPKFPESDLFAGIN